MDQKDKKSADLAKIEKELEKKVTPIKTESTQKTARIDLGQLQKIAQRIQKFEDRTHASSYPGV